MLKDYIRFSFNSLKHRKLRSWLTMIGIFIGIAAVVALISISQGMQDSIKEQFQKLGTDKLIVMPGSGGLMETAMTSEELSKDDFDIVQKVDGVDLAAEMFYKTGSVKFKDETKSLLVIGLPTDETKQIIEEMQGFEAEQGRDLKEGDNYKVTVGYNLWHETSFEKKIGLRDKLEIEDKEFEVIGLIKKVGNSGDDSQIYVPLETAREIFEEKTEVSAIYLQIKKGEEVNAVADKIKEELRDFRDEEEGEETFQVQTFEQILSQVQGILGIVGLVLIFIALISIVVGGVGIMNTMYTSVLERTKEIGIMKAVGAKNSDIMSIFLVESGMLGLTGGLIGVVLGIGLSKIVELIAYNANFIPLKVYLGAPLIIGALFFSFLIGAASGTLPAIQASKMKPVDALRYE